MTKFQVASVLLDILFENPKIFEIPMGKDHYRMLVGERIHKSSKLKSPNRKTVKRALKLLIELKCIVKLEPCVYQGSKQVNPCSRYRLTTEEERNA